MAIKLYRYSFGGGELAASMYGRIDDGKNQTGLAKCRNFIVEPQGPVRRRSGFQMVRPTKYADRPCALIPFTFSVTQTMVLEVGHQYIRFHTNGATVLNSDGTPYEIATPYDSSDVMDLEFCQSNDVITLSHVSYPPKELRRYGATDWRLVNIQFNSSLSAPTNVKATQTISDKVEEAYRTMYTKKYKVTALTADGAEESAASTAASVACNPYGDGAYNTISWSAVSGASLYNVYRSEGGVYSFIGQTNELSIVDDNISADSGITPPIYDNNIFTAAKAITAVSVTNGGSGYKVQGVPYIKSLQLGELQIIGAKLMEDLTFKLEDEEVTPAKLATVAIDYEYKQLNVDGDTATFLSQIVIKSYSISGGYGYVSPVLKVYNSEGKSLIISSVFNADFKDSYGVTEGQATLNVSDSTGSGAVLSPVIEDGVIKSVKIVAGGQNYTNPTIVVGNTGGGSGATFNVSVAQGGDYPGATTYFEQRRCFAGTPNKPQNVWMTRSGTESNMSYSLPTQATDRIAIRVAAQQANRIVHLVPMAYLLMLTADAEWRVSPLNSDAITPDSISVRPQSYVGASKVQPVLVNNNLLYAASRGGHIRELGYNYQAGGYVTADVSLRASHLFDNLTIKDMTFSKAPYPILYAVSSNGNLIAYTYVPEQQVGAFSVFETKGVFEACCVVAEGDEDILYCVIRREINGAIVRFVERMHELIVPNREDFCYLDCAGVYEGEAKSEISGLDWLEGETVSILADGYCVPDQVVQGGTITLEEPASKVHVGLSYQSDLQTLPASAQIQDGSYGFSHRKNLTEVTFRLEGSSSISAGPDADHLRSMPARRIETPGTPAGLFEGEHDLPITGLWTPEGQLFIRESLPLPIKIISITIEANMT